MQLAAILPAGWIEPGVRSQLHERLGELDAAENAILASVPVEDPSAIALMFTYGPRARVRFAAGHIDEAREELAHWAEGFRRLTDAHGAHLHFFAGNVGPRTGRPGQR